MLSHYSRIRAFSKNRRQLGVLKKISDNSSYYIYYIYMCSWSFSDTQCDLPFFSRYIASCEFIFSNKHATSHKNSIWKRLLPLYIFRITSRGDKYRLLLGDSQQPWAGVCLGPIVFFQKVWKEKSWNFYMNLKKWFR